VSVTLNRQWVQEFYSENTFDIAMEKALEIKEAYKKLNPHLNLSSIVVCLMRTEHACERREL